MILGAVLQTTAYTVAHIIVARIFSGIGMGFINSTVPVFQSEFSPKASRGLCESLRCQSGLSQTLTRDFSRLYAIINPEFWNFPRLLDRLRIVL